jgi:hypothetical protein
LVKYTVDLRPGIVVKVGGTIYVGFSWREIIGEKWDIGALVMYLGKERWDTFVDQNKYLILHAILNFKNSREKLSVTLDELFTLTNNKQGGNSK